MSLRSQNTIPDDVEALKAALIAAQILVVNVESELATARAKNADDDALIAHLEADDRQTQP